MIPVLNKYRKETGDFKKTLADVMLPEYDLDLAIYITDENANQLTIPVWRFVERYLRLINKKGQYSCFELKKPQIDFYIELCKQKQTGEPMRINILKARQLGFSTFIAAIIFVLTILVPNQTASIIADKAEHATNLFKKYKFFYHNLPDFIKARLPLVSSNAKELSVDYGDGQMSTVRILVQGDNAGRSDSCQYLHLSEVAFWQNINDTLTSVLQTVDESNENSLIVFETTANGVNDYKTIYDADSGGRTCYKALFYAWYLDPDYRLPYNGFEFYEWEKELKKKHNLDNEQMAWYRRKYQSLRGDIDKLKQELPSNPVEAFITSGNSVFNLELLLKRKEEVLNAGYKRQGDFLYEKKYSLDGTRIDISKIRFSDSPLGNTFIYKEPNPTHPYIVSNDPAMGGEDYYATQVFDNYTGEQVAVYHKNKCDADEVAIQMYCLAVYYNKALLTGETNTTSYLLELAHKCGYRFIYQDQDVEDLSGRFQNKFGYKTKQNNRNYMIDLFKIAFRENPNIINDYETLCEMEQFQVVRHKTNQGTTREKIEASGDSHDDLVMAACGYYLCRDQQEATPKQVVLPSELKQFDPFEVHKKEQEKERVYQIWD